ILSNDTVQNVTSVAAPIVDNTLNAISTGDIGAVANIAAPVTTVVNGAVELLNNDSITNIVSPVVENTVNVVLGAAGEVSNVIGGLPDISGGNLPGLPGLPELPGMPGLPNLGPDMLNLGDLPGVINNAGSPIFDGSHDALVNIVQPS